MLAILGSMGSGILAYLGVKSRISSDKKKDDKRSEIDTLTAGFAALQGAQGANAELIASQAARIKDLEKRLDDAEKRIDTLLLKAAEDGLAHSAAVDRYQSEIVGLQRRLASNENAALAMIDPDKIPPATRDLISRRQKGYPAI